MYKSLDDLAYHGASFARGRSDRSTTSKYITSAQPYYYRWNPEGVLEVVTFPNSDPLKSKLFRILRDRLRQRIDLRDESPSLEGSEVINYLKKLCPN